MMTCLVIIMVDEQIRMMLILKYGSMREAGWAWADEDNDDLIKMGWTQEEIDHVENCIYSDP